ncbi:hypothetical protein [Rhizohabitans arisaemae]|uniref:hypothetical protein n=1 Tax=Rhizohabitans arisaemae TaxID=2720610 RepID=UPI0024B10E15|nr:hypothetical protein [Rhizohabitans arisaemae]
MVYAWIPDGPLALGDLVDVVEIPLLGSMIDVPQMEFLVRPPMPGLHAYDKILKMWCDELDWMCEFQPDGVLSLVLHPTTIPRGARLRVLRDFLRHAKARGARFLRHGEVADTFRATHPLP